MGRKAEIILEYQNYIENPPIPTDQLYGQACSNDKVTVESWHETWLNHIKANHDRFGSFKEHGIGKLFGAHHLSPAIVAGSGPSLKVNYEHLKKKGKIPLLSCLHNFHFFEDQGIPVDYYVSLDAGPVVLEEVSEGGKRSPEEYWEITKDRTLLCYIGTDPKLFEKWKGKVYFFNAPVPHDGFMAKVDEIEKFHTFVSNGGNVLGSCLYIAKGIFGSNPIAFVGADFCFSYDKKFHAWDSKYDKNLGYVVKAFDVYGNKVLTWQSYANFKAWFDFVAMRAVGVYINCSEGGTFGAYAEGNIMAVKQMELEKFIWMCNLHEELRDQCENPETDIKKILF